MKLFQVTNIFTKEDEVAGELKRARENLKLSLQKASNDLKIKIEYLEALEQGDFDKLPKGVYRKNFLREYVLYLRLDYKDFEKTFAESKLKNKKKYNPFSKKVVKDYKLIIFPKLIKNFLIVLVVIICLMYLLFSLKEIIAPPFLEISNPEDNMVIDNSFINIVGISEAEAEVSINGKIVIIDKEGLFSKKVDLSKGINQIIIKAKKKYSQENIIIKQILVNK
jgi:preprotein translocase subunit SecE